MEKYSTKINKLCLSSMFLALGWLMPFLTGQIPEIGSMLAPMHIPALLCGFILGPFYGLGIGFLMPLSRSLIFGTPYLYPMAISMAFELATYGFIAGFLFKVLNNKTTLKATYVIFISLLSAMLLGRVVWGVSRFILGLTTQNAFTFNAFLVGAFITAWPGILIQLVLIPCIVRLLYGARLLDKFLEIKRA